MIGARVVVSLKVVRMMSVDVAVLEDTLVRERRIARVPSLVPRLAEPR
jgi:hypothetical protein